jgi:prophage maintenance system killer protein
VDGNKRIAVLLFLTYLELNGFKISIDRDSLSSTAVFIAESNPKSKFFVIENIVALIVKI